MERLKEDRIELLFLHDYEIGRTKEDIEEVVSRLLCSGLVQKVGLSNFPAELTEYLVKKGSISCLQVDCFSPDKEAQISIVKKTGIDCWIYRPFDRGRLVKGKSNREIMAVAKNLIYGRQNCRLLFGASDSSQLDWLGCS